MAEGGGAGARGKSRTGQRGRKRTVPMPFEQRGATLRALFEEIKAAKEPCYPALFCERAGITKGTLRKFEDLALEVWDYGAATWPAKMRGRRPVLRGRSGTNSNLEKEHGRWSRELPKLRLQIRSHKGRITELEAENAHLKECLALRSRLLEVLIHRAAERGTKEAKDVQRLLVETLEEESRAKA